VIDLLDWPEGPMKFETRHSPHTLLTNLHSYYVDLLTLRCVYAALKSPALGEGVAYGLVGGASLASCGKTIVAR
jgi:hypothetical protein